jgi:hypothetical protein
MALPKTTLKPKHLENFVSPFFCFLGLKVGPSLTIIRVSRGSKRGKNHNLKVE